MRNHKSTLFLVLFTLAVVAMTTMATLRNGTQDSPSGKQQPKEESYKQRLEFESQFPVVDYDAPESADPEKRAKRKIKNKRYDKLDFGINDPTPNIGRTSIENDWALHVTPLPAGQSEVVVVGDVQEAETHLSVDKSGIYSEFTIRVDEVLKGNVLSDAAQSKSIKAERIGGIVRYASGHKRLYHIMGQNMPRVGRRYVLFLNTIEQSQDYSILTGYELRAGKVFPLDASTRMNAYTGMDETAFMKAVRDAIDSPA